MAQKQVSELQVKTILKPKIRQFKKIKTNSLKDKKKNHFAFSKTVQEKQKATQITDIRNRRRNIISYPTNIMFT